MPFQLVIPDDYQYASRQHAALFQHDAIHTTVLGDLQRDPHAASALAQADALLLIRERTVVDAAFLAAHPRLRLISQTGKVARNIDIDACSRAGVAVVEGSGSPIAPAELTWLLMMAARRQFVPAVNSLYAGQWQRNIGQAMHGAVLGILGFGKIGKRLAGYGHAFGMQVVVWGSERARNEAVALGYRAADNRAAFFADCDIITVHQRLVPATAANISASDLARMKPSALFVNTSRAELVADGALLTALRAGRPGYAALDVYENEPLYDPQHPLLQLPNVLCSPHLGYVEQASYALYLQGAFENIVRYLAGERSHVLNPGDAR
jgi:D-3-phosphoglycerate dehydrogenase